MPNCDVCLVECRDGGVLACRHVVCRTCGMSQSKCLVCARIGGKARRRANKRGPTAPTWPEAPSESPEGSDAPPRPDVSPPAPDPDAPDDVSTTPMDPLTVVTGPTAFDEVRVELRPIQDAPRLARPALRASGKLSVRLLAKFVHARLNLPLQQAVVLRCAGQDLIAAMTLGQLGTHVWPKGAGHVVLEYKIGATEHVQDSA